MPDPTIAFTDVEIGLTRWNADCYRVDLRVSLPDSNADVRPIAGGPVLAHWDESALRALYLDPAAYGQALTRGLFADERLRTAFASARAAAAQTQARALRLRLFIDSASPELHALRWETLCDPQDGSPLATSERVVMARYLSSPDWRPVKLRPFSELHALVCIANPSDLASYDLAPVDVSGELARVQSALGAIPVTALAEPGSATLNNVIARLRDNVDLFYLVCHGALIEGEAKLYLEQEDGTAQVVNGGELVKRLCELPDPPRLVVLASCASAKMQADESGALAALGPQLAESGVPAVIAMQGNISMQTIEALMPAFFRELVRDGQIDRALAAARGEVKERPDSWMPVLFMRLKSGRIWYVPGFGGDEKGFERWPVLLNKILVGPDKPARCTPILGPWLSEFLLSPRSEIALNWAEQYGFPLSPFEREDLAEVAQFLSINQGPTFPREELSKYLEQAMWRRHGDKLPPELKGARLSQLIAAAGAAQRAADPSEPHAVLASLPFPVYVTMNPDNLVAEALRSAGKQPRVELCHWNEDIQTPSVYDQEPNYHPTVQQPLVYCLLGQLDDEDSLVLTEDDYFDYLIGLTRNKDLIPLDVRQALTNTALLFLGFQLEDWTFRVPFRYIVSQEGGRLRDKFPHIAAQVDPDERQTLIPARAHRFLESYFQKAQINIYWGTVQDFARDLQKQVQARAQASGV